MSDAIKWHQQEIARQQRRIYRNRHIFWTAFWPIVAAGIGYGLGRWPDVVARVIAGWL